MAAVLPIITKNAQGCRDIIRNGKDGLMVETNDEINLSEAMKTIMSDKIRNNYIACSQSRVLSFSWDNIVEKYIKLYLEILSASNSG